MLECSYCGLDYKVTNKAVIDGLDRGTITGHYCTEQCWNDAYDEMIRNQISEPTKEKDKGVDKK